MRAFILAILALTIGIPALALETETLFDGTNISSWDTARDQDRLAREFSVSELAATKDPVALRWRFVPRNVGFNDIFLMQPLERPFSAIRVRVQNEAETFDLALKVRDADGAEWTVPAVTLPAQGGWQWVEFPREKWTVASWSRDADGKLDFPLSSVTLIAFGIKSNLQYSLRVAQIDAVRPDPPIATLHQLRLPERLEAGKRYSVPLSFSLDKPCEDDTAYLSFTRGKNELFRIPLRLPQSLTSLAPGQRINLPQMPLQIPRYAFGGRSSVVLHLGEARIRQEGHDTAKEVGSVTITQRPTSKTVAAVKPFNGVPTLFINGKPHNGMTWATYGPSSEVFSDFTKAGITLYTFAATPTESGYGLSQTAWTAPGEYDFSQLDQRAMMLLQENPNAYFFPRLYVHAPKWWSEKHPDDLVLVDPGDGKLTPFIHSGGKLTPSWASETWRRDTIEGLRHLIAHVEASPYADRVIGYHIASGTTEEWMMWGGNENEWVDYSPVNTARFRDWLRAKYLTEDKLRAAWQDNAVTFATAAIPLKAQRQRSEFGNLRDPKKEQACIDYYLYNSDLVADTIATFTKAVKDITHHEKICGVFYGYLLQLCGEQRQQNAGHLALAKVLSSPDVDFVCSPTSYAFRGLGGEGTSHFMSLLGSVRMHGKLWFDENDIRTSLSGGAVGEWGRPANVAGDIIQQEKELANCITNGTAQWWFDVGSNKYNDPALMSRIGGLARSATAAQSFNRAPVDQVAMVVDEKSLCNLRVADPLGAWLLVSQLPALSRIGAPVGHYLASDLPRLTDHKVFFIMTSFAPTEADRKAIDALKRDGHILVFFHTPGLYNNGQIDEAAMADFTGIKLRLSTDPATLKVTLKAGNALTDGLGNVTYGQDHQTFPTASAADPEAQVLGTLADGRPGLVIKRFPTWTAIHSSAPMMPTSLMRKIAELGGVHTYIDTPDVVWASRDLLSVCVKEPGKRTIRLPRKAAVSDLYSGQPVAAATDSFEADFAEDATRVFVLK